MKTNVLFTVEPIYEPGMRSVDLLNAMREALPDADYVLRTALGVDSAVIYDGIYQPIMFAHFLAALNEKIQLMRVTAVYNTPRIGYVGYYRYDCHDNGGGLQGTFHDYDRIVDDDLESWQIMGSITGTPSGEYSILRPIKDKQVCLFSGCPKCHELGEVVDVKVDDYAGTWVCPKCGTADVIKSHDHDRYWHVRSWDTSTPTMYYDTLCGRDEEPEPPSWPAHMVSLIPPISVSSLEES